RRVGGDSRARAARRRGMVDHVKPVGPQGLQFWRSTNMKELGWNGAPIVLSGFAEPFDSWGDMRHLTPRESWPHPPRALAYFCNSLPDPGAGGGRSERDYPGRRREEWLRNIVRFLNPDIVHLWGEATQEPGEFRWHVLVDPHAP